ncbi:hypothetical protein [Mesorhizobium sp. NZP2077]|uniref:hypothetical protein n=1 Tax=Mesorhizobium sp. NZP2077 TaxID=2483404 RepID=UPI001554C1DD|nr:hypothetical protein [Mesorhizobium sp. NZP2077]QKC83249.1 hypothetical protein EB232_17975 [Mesorhizobium sp. NZP2077]QKD16765.1 hypothetical protein HGP13_17755 [Mesorhizobium sp. NZP2077]
MFQPVERKQFAFNVSPKVFDAIGKRAREQGLSPTAYAKLLFEAGFAALVGQERDAPVDDAELDRQVTLVFACAGQGDIKAIAKATGVKPTLVERILEAWRKAGK